MKIRNVAIVVMSLVSLTGCSGPGSPPLWPGSKYTEADRLNAMLRALRFIERSASDPTNFNAQASDYMYCFYSISVTSREPELRAAARPMAVAFAKRWAAARGVIPPGADQNEVSDMLFGWLAASLAGESDAHIKPQLRTAVAKYGPVEYLLFDPMKEPPPSDLPDTCKFDQTVNPRGAKVCKKCGRPLKIRTKYDVWMDALITTHGGDRYGIQLGAPYREVVKWLPAMRPYPKPGEVGQGEFLDCLYALTHLVYTLNDYGRYQLPRDLLPLEFAYVKQNLGQAIALHDPETMGEFLDTLKSFGMDYSDEVIRTGITYLLDTQRPDGTWSAPHEKDAYTLYHSAWTAIDGLKECRWQGEGLTFPEVKPLLESMREQPR
jgi:hypothetical protein